MRGLSSRTLLRSSGLPSRAHDRRGGTEPRMSGDRERDAEHEKIAIRRNVGQMRIGDDLQRVTANAAFGHPADQFGIGELFQADGDLLVQWLSGFEGANEGREPRFGS